MKCAIVFYNIIIHFFLVHLLNIHRLNSNKRPDKMPYFIILSIPFNYLFCIKIFQYDVHARVYFYQKEMTVNILFFKCSTSTDYYIYVYSYTPCNTSVKIEKINFTRSIDAVKIIGSY